MRIFGQFFIAIVVLLMFTLPAYAGHTAPPWDHQMNSPGRFLVLSQFGGEAVLDKETGLVWEQTPSTNSKNWFNAHASCYNSSVGGRMGWRLPTLQELMSLLDPAQLVGPKLPAGHPFDDVQSANYWSASEEATLAGHSNRALVVPLNTAVVGSDLKATGAAFAWCVRGGQGVDPQ